MVCEHRLLCPLAWNSSITLQAGLMKDNEFWFDCSAPFSCQRSRFGRAERFNFCVKVVFWYYSSSKLSACVFPPVSMTWARMTSTTVCRARTMGMTSMRTSLRWKYDNPWWELCVTTSALLPLGMFLSIIDVVVVSGVCHIMDLMPAEGPWLWSVAFSIVASLPSVHWSIRQLNLTYYM